jgi:hypothetical protein
MPSNWASHANADSRQIAVFREKWEKTAKIDTQLPRHYGPLNESSMNTPSIDGDSPPFSDFQHARALRWLTDMAEWVA